MTRTSFLNDCVLLLSRTFNRFSNRAFYEMNKLAILLLLSLAGCATPAVVSVTGNHSCHPSSDLPTHKVIKKVPEVETDLGTLFGILLEERKDHATDVRDYNSLYSECVSQQ